MTAVHIFSRLVVCAIVLGAAAGVRPAAAGAATAGTAAMNAPVTVRIDPPYQHPEIEGWGTSAAQRGRQGAAGHLGGPGRGPVGRAGLGHGDRDRD